MPIDIDCFEDADDLRAPSTSERIIRFLLADVDQAYTRQEISDAIDVNPETVGTNLTRLKDRGLVRHHEPYWALTEDRDQAINTLRTQYSALDERPTDDWDEWNEYDIPSDDRNQVRDDPDADNTPASLSLTGTTRPHHETATAVIERVRDRLDDSIVALYLFGSVARHTATADSDVDVFAVIADDVDYVTVDDQLLDIAYEVQLEYGVRVEVHSLRAGEFAVRKNRGDPFIRTVVEEGIVDV